MDGMGGETKADIGREWHGYEIEVKWGRSGRGAREVKQKRN